jgi:hypothetical protein
MLRLNSNENSLLLLIAEFADTTDPRNRQELEELLNDEAPDQRLVRRIGAAIVGRPPEDLQADELKAAERFKRIAANNRRHFRDFQLTDLETSLRS